MVEHIEIPVLTGRAALFQKSGAFIRFEDDTICCVFEDANDARLLKSMLINASEIERKITDSRAYYSFTAPVNVENERVLRDTRVSNLDCLAENYFQMPYEGIDDIMPIIIPSLDLMTAVRQQGEHFSTSLQ